MVADDCRNCDGRGVIGNNEPCPSCRGSGNAPLSDEQIAQMELTARRILGTVTEH